MPAVGQRITPTWQKAGIRIFNGDVRRILPQLPAESVHMALTSPPYFGMRVYKDKERKILDRTQHGCEETFEEYLATELEIYRGLFRILRDDGVFFLNIGDSYIGNPKKNGGTLGAPWKLAFAMEADGWILRQDLIWYKPNATPDGSTTDRCTKAHEYVFMFVKRRRYYLDGDAERKDVVGAMPRSVWKIAAKSYKGHPAAFPEELVRRCINMGTSYAGACPECGTQWKRVTKKVGGKKAEVDDRKERDRSHPWSRNGKDGSLDGDIPDVVTTGWQPGCECGAEDTIPAVVFDPFTGSGTTAAVAYKMGRRFVGAEMSTEYANEVAIPRLENLIVKGEE